MPSSLFIEIVGGMSVGNTGTVHHNIQLTVEPLNFVYHILHVVLLGHIGRYIGDITAALLGYFVAFRRGQITKYHFGAQFDEAINGGMA